MASLESEARIYGIGKETTPFIFSSNNFEASGVSLYHEVVCPDLYIS